jgi:hypothetical protein
LHPDLILKAIPAVSGKNTLSQFKFMSDIRSLDVAKDLLNFLVLNSIGIISPDNTIIFSEVDRIKTAILALRSGCDIERIAKALNWKDFESFASGIMKELGYKVQTNITLTKPRFQIDLVGICSNLAVVADCKHWRYSNRPMIIKAAINQIRRAALLMDRREDFRYALPIILTMHDHMEQLAEGIPVVSIGKLHSFLLNLEQYVTSYDVLRADGKSS